MGQKLLLPPGKIGRSQEMRTESRALIVSECIWQRYSHCLSSPDNFKFQRGGLSELLFCRVITKEVSRVINKKRLLDGQRANGHSVPVTVAAMI